VEGLTAPFGAPYIADRTASAVAAHAVTVMASGLADDPPDAAVIACFGDPGLWAAREMLACPVIGMAEASLHTACQIGRRVAIITGGAGWGPMLEEFVALCGLSPRLATVHALAPTGAALADDAASALDALAAAVETVARDHRADVAILGGAGLVGYAAALRGRVPIPLVDSLDAALAQAVALVSLD
jgi:Asp/Glu/hydantoin racemase